MCPRDKKKTDEQTKGIKGSLASLKLPKGPMSYI